jgi:hypothetical protein
MHGTSEMGLCEPVAITLNRETVDVVIMGALPDDSLAAIDRIPRSCRSVLRGLPHARENPFRCDWKFLSFLLGGSLSCASALPYTCGLKRLYNQCIRPVSDPGHLNPNKTWAQCPHINLKSSCH